MTKCHRRKKAQEQQDYDGHIVNAIYENDEFVIENGEPKQKVNSFKDRGALVGAFCSVYRKNTRVPFFVTVQLEEFRRFQTGSNSSNSRLSRGPLNGLSMERSISFCGENG